MGAHLLIAGTVAVLWTEPTGAGTRSHQRNIDGVVNFHRLKTTVACSGAIKSEALPNIQKMGFVSVINFREPTEPGANVEAGEAAKAAGLRYYRI